MGLRAGWCCKRELHMASQNVIDRWAFSFVRDQVDIHLCVVFELGVHQLRHAAITAVVEFAWVVASVGN